MPQVGRMKGCSFPFIFTSFHKAGDWYTGLPQICRAELPDSRR